MNRRRCWTTLNQVIAMILLAGACAASAYPQGQKPPVAPPAVRPGAVKPGSMKPGAVKPPALRPGAVKPGGPVPAAATAAAVLTAGPTYTNLDGKGAPRFPHVDIVFTLTGADGKPLQPNPSDLQLYAQNKQIATATSFRRFDQTGYGVTSILAIDASGSMRGAPLDAIHATIAKFVGQARTQDRVGVVTFADDTRMDVPFNHTQTQMTAELQTVKARGTTTRLWDGLLYALDQYKPDSPPRRLLVVISDGHDEGSQAHLDDVISKAKERSVVISSIGLTRDRGQYLHFLAELSAATGGSFRQARSATDLDGMIQDGLAAQHATPVALFDASRLTADGIKQNVELRWLPGKLSAPTSIQTLKGGGTKAPAVDRLWLWGLGGCFVAGIILLAVSWKSARRKPMPVEPYPAAGASFSPGAPAAPFADAGFGTPSYDRAAPAVPRSPTIDESGFTPRLAPKQYVPTETPIVDVPRIETLQEQAAAPGRQRSVTQLSGVFDAPPEGPYAWLQIKSGTMAGTGLPVTAVDFSIGAIAGNHLVLPGDTTISGRHARLLWESGILKVEDSQSTNGTYLNGLKLDPGRHVLRPGDELRLGKVVLQVSPA